MEKKKVKRIAINISIALKQETKDKFESLCKDMEVGSKEEMLNMLMDKFFEEERVVEKIVEKVVEVPKEVIVEVPKEVKVEVLKEVRVEVPISLKETELLLKLNPVQFDILKELVSSEKAIIMHNQYFNKRQNFTNFLFEEINENDTLKVKTAKFLLNICLFHYVYGAGDWLPFTGRKSDIMNKILTHHPELRKVED